MINKMLFWNIRSVRSQRAFERLMDLNRKHQYSYIAILEPFQSPVELEIYRRRLGMANAKTNMYVKIWIFWSEDWEELESMDTIQQLTCQFCIRGTRETFKITAVTIERLELWEDLEYVASTTTCPWMVGGDFNTILNDAEKLGGLPVTITETVDFAQCLGGVHLMNLGSSYNWWNGRIEGDIIFKRLDRVLGNNEFMNMLPDTEVPHLIRQGSDHAPLHVECNAENNHIAKPFKFMNFWTKHSEFHKRVEESWQNECIGTPIKVLQTKLKRVKMALVE
ncbi:hypothetical protein R3W88_025447 [Solanum pinnatisectum]|uniref:Endonuclease/exonuclease/phosphatase domain-containing protein n=1 Tax=Solanum pinnatisectum TaxID=50273 RepID=A0AAV9M3K5_9SOLN|nr:hypothetical protein R3W88_025447 [Solanum pinnatisectum]